MGCWGSGPDHEAQSIRVSLWMTAGLLARLYVSGQPPKGGHILANCSTQPGGVSLQAFTHRWGVAWSTRTDALVKATFTEPTPEPRQAHQVQVVISLLTGAFIFSFSTTSRPPLASGSLFVVSDTRLSALDPQPTFASLLDANRHRG